jgi:hypothetical protein
MPNLKKFLGLGIFPCSKEFGKAMNTKTKRADLGLLFLYMISKK